MISFNLLWYIIFIDDKGGYNGKKKETAFGGNPVTLLGKKVEVGDKAYDFTALKGDLSPFKLSDTKGKLRIISAVPSLDTPVCELQTVRFNEEAEKLKDVQIITISMDLPFAQGKFCSSHNITNEVVVSDHKDADFGINYGFLIEEFRLLNRGIIVIDKDDTVRYVEYVKENTNHPDYDKALEEAKKLI